MLDRWTILSIRRPCNPPARIGCFAFSRPLGEHAAALCGAQTISKSVAEGGRLMAPGPQQLASMKLHEAEAGCC